VQEPKNDLKITLMNDYIFVKKKSEAGPRGFHWNCHFPT